jgi:hypothetical protein
VLKLIEKEFPERTIANMEIALERSCRFLPSKLDETKTRKAVAGVIIKCAREKTATLAGMTEAARQAIAFLLVEESTGEASTPPGS